MTGIIRTTPGLDVEHITGKWWRIKRRLAYYVGNRAVCALPGDVTDFSSTPRLFDLFMAKNKGYYSGAIHDQLYRKAKDCEGKPISRWEADNIWYHITRYGDNRANWLQAAAGRIGLFLGGWIPWMKYRNQWEDKPE